METGPSPVVFKTLGNMSAPGDFAIKTVKMSHFSVSHFKPLGATEYFILTNNADPSHPLKLFKSGLEKLIKALPFAIKEADRLGNEKLPDNENFNAGIINSYGKMKVRLVLSTFQEQVYIWLRLYTEDEEGRELPTKTAVRFSKNDNIASLENLLSA